VSGGNFTASYFGTTPVSPSIKAILEATRGKGGMETVGGGGELKVITWGVWFPVVGCSKVFQISFTK
jgi:hypothetical protein